MTCRNCGRTISIVKTPAGDVSLDPEVISVVVFELRPGLNAEGRSRGPSSNGAIGARTARRVHAEMCMKYKLERERAEARRKLRLP